MEAINGTPTQQTFILAQNAVETLMRKDSYHRFLRSSFYQSLKSSINRLQEETNDKGIIKTLQDLDCQTRYPGENGKLNHRDSFVERGRKSPKVSHLL